MMLVNINEEGEKGGETKESAPRLETLSDVGSKGA